MSQLQSQIGQTEDKIVQKIWDASIKSQQNLLKRERQLAQLITHLSENSFPSNFKVFDHKKHVQLPDTFSNDLINAFNEKMSSQMHQLKLDMLNNLIEAYTIDVAILKKEVDWNFNRENIFSILTEQFLISNDESHDLLKSNIALALNVRRGIFLNPKTKTTTKIDSQNNDNTAIQELSQAENQPMEEGEDFPLTQNTQIQLPLQQQQTPIRSPPYKKRAQDIFKNSDNFTFPKNMTDVTTPDIMQQLKTLTEKLENMEMTIKTNAEIKNVKDPTQAQGRWIGGQNDGHANFSDHRNFSRNNHRNSNNQWRGRNRSTTPRRSRSRSNSRNSRYSNSSRSPYFMPKQYGHGLRGGRGRHRGRGNRDHRR